MSALAQLLTRRKKTQRQLAVLIGSRSRASELMTGKRYLTKDQIALLNQEWGIGVTALFAVSFPPSTDKRRSGPRPSSPRRLERTRSHD
jgi:HTH-type transcriptional regulator/antitoxin HigA